MAKYPSSKHEGQPGKEFRQIDDTYVFDESSGLYEPKPVAERDGRQRHSYRALGKLRVRVATDWLTIFVSVLTLMVIGAYTEFARRQWVETKNAAKAAESAATTARQQLEMSERPWVDADIKIAGPLTFNINGGSLPLMITFRNSGNSPAFGTSVVPQIVIKLGGPDVILTRNQICDQVSEDDRWRYLSVSKYQIRSKVGCRDQQRRYCAGHWQISNFQGEFRCSHPGRLHWLSPYLQ